MLTVRNGNVHEESLMPMVAELSTISRCETTSNGSSSAAA